MRYLTSDVVVPQVGAHWVQQHDCRGCEGRHPVQRVELQQPSPPAGQQRCTAYSCNITHLLNLFKWL